jgi:predicted enzyme related to lactoylglutathione lyase
MAAAGAAILAGAMGSRAALPPLNHPSSKTANPGKFEWADLYTGDLETAEQFYTGLFGWSASASSDPRSYKDPKGGHKREYIVLSENGVPVAGLVQRSGPVSKTEHPARWVGYFAVSNLAASLKSVTAAGGKVASSEHRVPDRGKQAIIVDPDGAVVGLLQSSSGDLADRDPAAGQWLWFELYSQDPKTAGVFYQRAFNYEFGPDSKSDKPDHYFLTSGARARAGITSLHFAGAKPDWLGFVRVDDLEGSLSKVKSLGGEVVVPTQQSRSESRFALVSDPTGGVFGLVQFPGNAAEAARSATSQPTAP